MDKETFSEKVLSMEKGLYHVARSILRCEEDCEDALQEAILRAYSSLGGLREEAYFKTWLTRILINECYKICNSQKNTAAYREAIGNDTAADMNESAGLYEAVGRLEEPIRTVVVLYYLQGFSIREISSLLGISQGSTKTRLYRGRKMLKELLKGVYGYV